MGPIPSAEPTQAGLVWKGAWRPERLDCNRPGTWPSAWGRGRVRGLTQVVCMSCVTENGAGGLVPMCRDRGGWDGLVKRVQLSRMGGGTQGLLSSPHEGL